MKEELNNCLTKESEAIEKRKELEKKYEALECEATTAKTDLKLALKRIDDLQSVIQGELEGDTSSENSDRYVFILCIYGLLIIPVNFSEQDSYSSDESVNTFLANHNISPTKTESSDKK